MLRTDFYVETVLWETEFFYRIHVEVNTLQLLQVVELTVNLCYPVSGQEDVFNVAPELRDRRNRIIVGDDGLCVSILLD